MGVNEPTQEQTVIEIDGYLVNELGEGVSGFTPTGSIKESVEMLKQKLDADYCELLDAVLEIAYKEGFVKAMEDALSAVTP